MVTTLRSVVRAGFCPYTSGMGRPPTGETPKHTVRMPDSVWKPAQEIAEERGETMTSIIEAALRRYIARHRKRTG